jgi:hypothetical protein
MEKRAFPNKEGKALTDWSKVEIPDQPFEHDIIYIAGPMTGIKDWNVPAFSEMADRLRKQGRNVINPHELHEAQDGVPWDWYLRRDLAQLVKCSSMVLLPGWGASRGATLEHHVAKTLGMTIAYGGALAEILSR